MKPTRKLQLPSKTDKALGLLLGFFRMKRVTVPDGRIFTAEAWNEHQGYQVNPKAVLIIHAEGTNLQSWMNYDFEYYEGIKQLADHMNTGEFTVQDLNGRVFGVYHDPPWKWPEPEQPNTAIRSRP